MTSTFVEEIVNEHQGVPPSLRQNIPVASQAVSCELAEGSKAYTLVLQNIAKPTKWKTTTSFALSSEKPAGDCCSDSDDSSDDSDTCKVGGVEVHSSLTGGLGVFLASEERGIYVCHMTVGQPVGSNCGAVQLKKLVLFGSSISLVQAYVDELIVESEKTSLMTITVYRWHVRHEYWSRDGKSMARPLESIVLNADTKSKVVDDIADFLHPLTRSWYADHGIPYRRGYLFYGEPGTGKTSLINGLAGKFRRNICFLQPAHPDMTDDGLKAAMTKLPGKSIVVLEDIDALFTKFREKKQGNSALTFSGLLNALDGVGSSTGQIAIMTTNERHNLDPALIRAGRVDLQIRFNTATKDQISGLFKQFLSGGQRGYTEAIEARFAEGVVAALKGRKLSPAALQGFFIKVRKLNAPETVDAIPQLIKDIDDCDLEAERDRQAKKDSHDEDDEDVDAEKIEKKKKKTSRGSSDDDSSSDDVDADDDGGGRRGRSGGKGKRNGDIHVHVHH